jgi:hypothetical protein
MAMTAEQRSTYKLCGARKKNGQPCRNFAGEGTDHLGIGRCKFHLGNTPAHKAHAANVEAQQRMIQLGGPIEMRPHEALLAMLHLASGHTAWLREEIGELDDLGSKKGEALTRLYGEERDRVARVAKAALDAGVAERQVALAERYGAAIATVLRAIFSDPELGLSRSQQRLLPTVLRRHLHAVEERQADGRGLLPALPAAVADRRLR